MSETVAEAVAIAVIGTGLIGKRHIAHVLSEPTASLAAIVEPLPIGLELATKHSVPCFPSIQALIAARNEGKIKVEAAIIGTPTQTHVPLGVALIEAGIFVLVEKPIADTATEAKKLVDAVVACKGGCAALIGQHRRFNPYTVALKSALNDNALGKILAVQGCWTVRKGGVMGGLDYYSGWKIQAGGGGTIAINMIHDIDLLRHLFGDIDTITCVEGPRVRTHPVEETGAVLLTFKSGVVGTFIFSDAAPSPYSWEGATGENPDLFGLYGNDVYTIFGSKGTIALPTLALQSFAHLDDPEKDGHWMNRLGVTEKYKDIAKSLEDIPPFTLQLRHFVRVVRGMEPPSCSAEEGYKSVVALEVMAKSMREKKTLVIPSM